MLRILLMNQLGIVTIQLKILIKYKFEMMIADLEYAHI